MTRLNTRITMLLTRLRDMRIVWDVMGPLYNRRIAESYRRQRNIFNCSFHQSDVLSLQFKDAAFDAAVSAGSIKHWSDSRRGLMELHRVLKPGGCLIIAETDREASDEDLRKFATRFHLPFVPKGLFFWGLRHVIFGQSFSQDQLADAVDRVGFHNVQCRRVPTCPYVIVKAWK